MEDHRFELFKEELFNYGKDYIEDFLGYDIDSEEPKDVTERRMDEAYQQMPDDILAKFYKEFNIG